MDLRRFIAPAWFTAYLAGFGMFLMGMILLGDLAVKGDNAAGGAFLALLGLVWARTGAMGAKRHKETEA